MYELNVPLPKQTKGFVKSFVWHAKKGQLNICELYLARINQILDAHDFMKAEVPA